MTDCYDVPEDVSREEVINLEELEFFVHNQCELNRFDYPIQMPTPDEEVSRLVC